MVNDAGIDWHTCGGNVHVHVIDIPSCRKMKVSQQTLCLNLYSTHSHSLDELEWGRGMPCLQTKRSCRIVPALPRTAARLGGAGGLTLTKRLYARIGLARRDRAAPASISNQHLDKSASSSSSLQQPQPSSTSTPSQLPTSIPRKALGYTIAYLSR